MTGSTGPGNTGTGNTGTGGQRSARSAGLVVVIAVGVVGAATASRWLPALKKAMTAARQELDATDRDAESGRAAGQHPRAEPAGLSNHPHEEAGHSHRDHAHTRSGHSHDDHGHAHDDHAHRGHDPADGHAGASHTEHQSNALSLSAAALRNVGLIDNQIRRVELTTFWRSITVPAQVVGRPGRTQVQVATPMTGMITHVHATRGEAVEPGALLFRIQLTHEDLLQLQTEFLQTIGELDVEEREIERLTEVTQSQAVPGRILLEREYQRDRLSALRKAQRESLRLHGLSAAQIEAIIADRRLIRELEVFAPTVDRHPVGEHNHLPVEYLNDDRQDWPTEATTNSPLVLEQLNVHKGQVVAAGTTLCVLKDYSELLIEGLAFEQDVRTLRRALQEQREVTAVFAAGGVSSEVVRGLKIEHLASEVDADSRSLRFFVSLTNHLTSEHRRAEARFVEWNWMIGQRVRLRVPSTRWKNQIVLPSAAVAAEGSANYVFRQHGEHFDRVAIRIKYRDPLFIVVERDGAISPGDLIAWQGARQMQTALRTQASGPVDAHHGHTH